MLTKEQGIVPDSDYYIYTPSAQAQNLFLYPLITGYFRYLPGYCLRRTSLDSFLIMHMKRGDCEVECGNRHFHAYEGQVVLLDCYAPHAYYSSKGWDAEWFHFDGVCARGYYEAVTGDGGPVISLQNSYRLDKYLHNIYLLFRESPSVVEPLLNNYIVNILTELLISQEAKTTNMVSAGIISDSIAYINEHLTEALSLDDLAGQASLSPYYFSRLFKKETGFSPHSYVITTRISNAKFLLHSSDLSVKSICFATGFTSESSFCTTFKKETGMTPSEYRAKVQD